MRKVLTLIFITVLFISACQENKQSEEIKDVEEKETFSLIEQPFIISSPFMRAGAKNRNSAAFMKITNNMNVNDTLFSVNSDLAKVTEIHETYEAENDMMGMRKIDFLVIPKNSVVYLKPGSFHIMLIGLEKDLVKGDSGKITLEFKNSGKVELPLTVKIDDK